MDGTHFDALARSFNSARSRRAALGGLLIATLGLLSTQGAEYTAAHNALLKCKKLKGDRKKKCKQKAKKHRSQHTKETPTCTDGLQNGSETGIDCGGACPRCATGLGCSTASDCASGLCSEGTCGTCAGDPDCGSDADGMCICRSPDAGGSSVCVKNSSSGGSCEGGSPCPTGTMCINNVGIRFCFKLCGAS
jgi:hypothetical protein